MKDNDLVLKLIDDLLVRMWRVESRLRDKTQTADEAVDKLDQTDIGELVKRLNSTVAELRLQVNALMLSAQRNQLAQTPSRHQQ